MPRKSTTRNSTNSSKRNATKGTPRSSSSAGRTPARTDGIDAHVEAAVREFPEIEPAVEGIVSRIEKLSRYLEKSGTDSLARHDLAGGEYKVLVKLRLAGAPYRLSPTDLSNELMLSSGAMTNRLDRLEERGLVARKPDLRDRRSILVELTDRGADVLASSVREQAALEARLVGDLSPAEQERLNDLLRSLMRNFQDVLGPPPRHRHADD
jgi:DNA-binding MarR family transcriptional regulator